ncbi:hypothetical protein GCM10020219_074600 [Nonomuraea dietziae]
MIQPSRANLPSLAGGSSSASAATSALIRSLMGAASRGRSGSMLLRTPLTASPATSSVQPPGSPTSIRRDRARR